MVSTKSHKFVGTTEAALSNALEIFCASGCSVYLYSPHKCTLQLQRQISHCFDGAKTGHWVYYPQNTCNFGSLCLPSFRATKGLFIYTTKNLSQNHVAALYICQKYSAACKSTPPLIGRGPPL